MDFIFNPVLLGIVAAALTYLYFYWEADKKYKKNPKIKRTSISLITPGIAGIVVWFVASSYFDKSSQGDGDASKMNELPKNEAMTLPNGANYRLGADLSVSSGSRSYHLIGRNKIRLPPTEDVFIDIAKF